MKPIALGAAVMLAGCAANSGIVELGGNQFILARQAATRFTSTSALQAVVMRDAALHFKAMGKSFKVLSEDRTTGAPIGTGNAWKTGARSAETLEAAALLRELAKLP